MIRIGVGYDVHRFEPGRPLILGGVTIPHTVGLAGHSDADVLSHAIADALLGAAALGDIGLHFPDTDESFRGADSLELLREVVALLSERGYRVNNVDATVAMQHPRLRPHIETMRIRLAEAMSTTADRVSVKATTTEGLGFVGQGQGASAYAVCTVVEEA